MSIRFATGAAALAVISLLLSGPSLRAQDEGAPMLKKAEAAFSALETVRYSLAYTQVQGRNATTYLGKAQVRGSRCRTEMVMETTGLHTLIVKDGETCWTVITPEGGARRYLKTPAFAYLHVYPAGSRMMTPTSNLQDPMDPGALLKLLKEQYEFAFPEEHEEDGMTRIALTGTLKPDVLRDEQDPGQREFMKWIEKVRLLLDEDTFLPAGVRFYRSDPGRFTYEQRYLDYERDVELGSRVFTFAPPPKAEVIDLWEAFQNDDWDTLMGAVALVSEPGSDLLEDSIKRLRTAESVTFHGKLSLMPFANMPLEGRCRMRGPLLRVEYRQKGTGVAFITTCDGESVWIEAPDPMNPTNKLVLKRPVDFVNPSARTGTSPLDPPTGLGPKELILMARNGYALEYRGLEEGMHRFEGPARDGEEGQASVAVELYADTLFPARVQLKLGGRAGLVAEFTDYETGVAIPDEVFAYTPPEGAEVKDLKKLAMDRFLLPDDTVLPALPEVKGISQLRPREGYRLELIVNRSGTFTAMKESAMALTMVMRPTLGEYREATALKWVLQDAVDTFGGAKRDPTKISDLDVVIFADREAPLERIVRLAMVCCDSTVMVQRIHFAVKDPASGEIELLPMFLPGDRGVRGDYSRACFRIMLKPVDGKAEYTLSRRVPGEEEASETHETLEALLASLDGWIGKHPNARILPGLAYIPEGAQPRLAVGDLVDLLAALGKRGADLAALEPVEVRVR